MGDENGVAFTDDGGNDVRYIGVTRRGRVTTRVPCVGQNVPSCDRHVIYQYISLTHSHSLCFLAGPSVGGIGTTVTSACVNVKRSKPRPDDPQVRLAMQVRTCNLRIRRHPIMRIRYTLLGRQQREQCLSFGRQR